MPAFVTRMSSPPASAMSAPSISAPFCTEKIPVFSPIVRKSVLHHSYAKDLRLPMEGPYLG
jgi:hypothetical protein